MRGQGLATVTGDVRDEDGRPLSGASIVILDENRVVVGRSTTDPQGRFSLALEQEGAYSVYALSDRPDTPGLDYVPSLWNTHLYSGAVTSFTFILRKGASLCFDGNVRFVESEEAADYYRFTVVREEGPFTDDLVTTYGSGTDLVENLGFNERLVVIPADTEVIVMESAQNSRANISDTFAAKGELGYFKLSQGDALHVDIRKYSLTFNLAKLRQMLDAAFSLHKDADDAGFLVTMERQELLEAYDLVDSSLASANSGLYDESFAKMRGAYILISKTTNYLRGLFQISSQTVLILPFFFVFIASALAYLVTDRKIYIGLRDRKRLSISVSSLTTVVLYIILFSSFYFMYPGIRITSQTSLITAGVLALIVWQVVTVAFPRMSSEKKGERRSIRLGSAIIITFSMAFRNLRRRRLRTVLSLASMIVFILGFVIFTSISPGYGLIKQSLRPAIQVDALLIKSLPPDSSLSFLSLPPSLVAWLKSQQNVNYLAPKAENIPSEGPIGSLYTEAGEEILVQGAIGVKSCDESTFTRIHNIIEDGYYLQADDEIGILLSSTLRGMLKIGDRVYGFGREFVIRGFFDPAILEKLADVDGQRFIPKGLGPSARPLPLRADQVIIVNYDTALTLPNVVTSRVNVQLTNPDPEEYSDFARMVTLVTGYQVYISHPGSLQLQFLGSFIEEKGAGLIPFLMVLVMLNISASMQSTVQERRNEIAIFSAVGLNPTHIGALFMAEAAVIGLIGGGLGYLLGILGYRLVPSALFGALQVREKTSADWGLIALILSSFTAILSSVIPSMRASTIITPSHLRKWRLDEDKKLSKIGQPWMTDLPIKIMPRELDPFTRFMFEKLRQADFADEVRLEEKVTDKGPLKRIIFRYSDQATYLSSATEITIQPATEDYFSVELRCTPSATKREEIAHKTATDMRRMIFEWKTRALR